MMRVKVRAFAALRDALGFSETSCELPEGVRVGELLGRLDEDHPAAGLIGRRFSTAVNRAFVAPDYVLKDGDELALIPPVSGG